MRIGIDARGILREEKRGGSYYAYNLIENLLKIDPNNQYILFYNFIREWRRKRQAIKKFAFPNVTARVYRIPSQILSFSWKKLHFPSMDLMLGGVDVFHTPCVEEIIPIHSKWIVTIHHLAPLKYLHYDPLDKPLLPFYKEVYKKVSLVIVPSETTKRELMESLNFSGNRIRVTPEATSSIFKPLQKEELPKAKEKLRDYGINERYILYVGGAYGNKNILRLIKAFGLLKEKTSGDYKLVLTGGMSFGYKEILKQISREKLKESIIYTGYVPEETLVILYNQAEFFISPSLWEGFGLSPLEAMACATPVALSRIPIFHELAGDSGLFFNPEDVEEMVEVMRKLLTDENLRRDLSKKAIERARKFSWEKTARQTLAVYKEVIEQK